MVWSRRVLRSKTSPVEKIANGFAHESCLSLALTCKEIEQLWPSDQHEIVLPGEVVSVGQEGFAQKALDPVADDGTAELLRHRKSQTRALVISRVRAAERIEDEEA